MNAKLSFPFFMVCKQVHPDANKMHFYSDQLPELEQILNLMVMCGGYRVA